MEREPPGRLLELGTGAGLVAISAARAGHRVAATDVNPAALILARRNLRENNASADLARAHLALGLRLARFDLVAFNPPYLPTGPAERLPEPLNRAFDGGPSGRRILEAFLTSLGNAPVAVLLVVSSLQGDPELDRLFRRHGRTPRTMGTASFDDERLRVVRLEPLRPDAPAEKP